MSAIGPKRTSTTALHMSANGGKADMTVCGSPLSRSLLGVKRTCVAALHESAFDPKRTYTRLPCLSAFKKILVSQQKYRGSQYKSPSCRDCNRSRTWLDQKSN